MSTRRTSQDFADTLARIWLFEECTKKERRRIASLVTPIRVDAGQVLARQGDYARECVIVIDGQAVVECDERIVGHAVDGSLVGEVALMDPRGMRNATVTAVTEMELLVMNRRDFINLRGMGVASIERRLAESVVAHQIREVFDGDDADVHRNALHSMSVESPHPEGMVDA